MSRTRGQPDRSRSQSSLTENAKGFKSVALLVLTLFFSRADGQTRPNGILEVHCDDEHFNTSILFDSVSQIPLEADVERKELRLSFSILGVVAGEWTSD